MDVYKNFFSSGKPDNYCEHVFRAYDPDNSGDIGKLKCSNLHGDGKSG